MAEKETLEKLMQLRKKKSLDAVNRVFRSIRDPRDINYFMLEISNKYLLENIANLLTS